MALRAFDRRLRDGGRMVPTEAVRSIPGHPLASFIKFIPGVGLKSVQNSIALQSASSATIAGTQDGPGLADTTTNAWASISVGGTAMDSALYAGPGATIAWRGLVNGPCNANNIQVFGTLRQSITSPYIGFCLANNPTTPGATVYWNSAGTFEQLSPASTAIAGAINTYVASFTFGGALVLYLNGTVISSTTTNTSAPATYSDDVLGIGGDFRTGQSANYPNVTTTCADWWRTPLTADEVAEWDALPFSMLERAGRIAVWDVGASGGVPFSTSAGLGSLLFAGDPLTAAAGASLSLGSGILDFTGAAPSIAAAAALATGLGAEPLSGFSPTVAAGASLSLGSGILDFTGFAPSPSAGVSTTAGGTGATQSAGESFAISAGANLTASLGTIWLSGQLPGVSAGANLTAGEQVLLLEGYPATVTTGAIPVAITAGLGAIQFLGLQPTVSALANYAYTFTLPEDVLTATLPLDVLTVTLPVDVLTVTLPPR